jgi:uncharacterized oxidoreductase
MNLSGNTVLITGGATGIGYEMAKAFLDAKSSIIICGRREERLLEVQKKYPGIHFKRSDVSIESERKSLVEWIIKEFNSINILVNNAGIQRDMDLTRGIEDIIDRFDEIKINLEAPIILSAMFIPHLLKQKEPAIINVSSGLAFVPMARFPVYCATKSALHSYTMSLRHQLKRTNIKVIEVIPPAIDTELNMEGRSKRNSPSFGVNASEFVQAVMKDIEKGKNEIGYGFTANFNKASKAELDERFKDMNRI